MCLRPYQSTVLLFTLNKIYKEQKSVDVPVMREEVVTGEFSAHKRSIEDTSPIDEPLKREEVLINKIGNPDIVDRDPSRINKVRNTSEFS